MLNRLDKGICLLFNDGVSCLSVTERLAHKSYRFLIPIVVLLHKYPNNSVFRGKGVDDKIFSVIRANKDGS